MNIALGQFDRILAGLLCPAADRHLSRKRVDPQDDFSPMGSGSRPDKRFIRNGRRPQNHTRHAVFQIVVDGFHAADAAADFNRHWNGFRNFDKNRRVFGQSGDGSVQIHKVNPLRPFLNPAPGHVHRIFSINRHPVKIALRKPHALAVFYINRRNNQHLA